MLQSAFAGKLILLKKFLNHIGKYKFNIHCRILRIIMIFFFEAFKMFLKLFRIFARDILGDRLHDLRILHLSYCHIQGIIFICKDMLVRMIKFLFHLLLQLLQN